MQTIVDDALDITEREGHAVKHVAVLDHKLAAKRSDVPWKEGRDIWWQDVMDALPSECPVEWVDAEAPLFKVCMPAFGSLQATFAFSSLCRGCPRKRKEKTTPFGVSLMISQVLYRASQEGFLPSACKLLNVHKGMLSYSSICKSRS